MNNMNYYQYMADMMSDLVEKLFNSVIKMNQGSLEAINSFNKLFFSYLEEKNKK